MNNKKVSVVVPVYNVEKYLNKCVLSIVNQTYKKLEILLIDDGSKDNSVALCDEWAKKDERIKVIHKENGGLSSARNAGIDNATGDYVMFEDSDDWLETELIERCVKRIEEEESDLVIFGYKKIDERGHNLGEFTFGDSTLSKEELVQQLYSRIVEMSFGYAWNKLYNLRVLKRSEIRNDSSIIDREDLVFNMQLLNHINKVSYLEYIGYNYLQRETSLLHNSNLSRLKNIKMFCDKMYEIEFGDDEIKWKVYSMNVLHYLSDCIIKNILWNDSMNKKEKKDWMEKVILECPHKDKLQADRRNSRYLRELYKTIVSGKSKYFYRYVWLSDLKRRFLKK